jgi:hypothetical protein
MYMSYSWSNPEHEAWVLRLATELRESGVDVILDKWDLKEGHDAHAFMERMVNDDEIKKVSLICDSIYVKKANNRTGGVGTETQIITPDIYSKQDQSKFVAVIAERDDSGKPYVPAYYRSRIHIDLSDPSTYGENFERLVRWVYDEPLHKKPELGSKPAYLTDANALQLGTSARFRRAVDAMKAGRDYASAAATEYLTLMAAEFEKLRLDSATDPFDDAVVSSIEGFFPYRNELIEFFTTAALYQDNDAMRVIIHRFFESLIPYLDHPPHINSWQDWDFDNFKFIIHELLLYLVAAYIRSERFEGASYFLEHEYYVPGNSDYGRDAMVPFTLFRYHLKALQHRNERLKLQRASVHADLLKERCKGVGVEFRHLMNADFAMYLCALIRYGEALIWWPETLVYLHDRPGPFEMFARSKSTAYFNRVKRLIGVNNKQELEAVVEAAEAQRIRLPRWHFHTLNLRGIVGLDQVATKP